MRSQSDTGKKKDHHIEMIGVGTDTQSIEKAVQTSSQEDARRIQKPSFSTDIK